MKQALPCLAMIGLLLLPGCFGAVRTPPSRSAVQRKAAADRETKQGEPTTGSSTAPTYQMAGTGPLTELVVKGISVPAEDIWAGRQRELDEKRTELSPEDFRYYVERESALLLNDRLAETLLYQEASQRMPKEASPRIDAFVDAEIRKTVTTEYGGVQRRYEKALAAEGRTLTQAREAIRRELVISTYLEQEIKPKVGEPTRQELVETFEQNRDSWRRPPRRKMSLIVLRVTDLLPQGVTEPTRDQLETARSQARSAALEIIASLDKGETFADLARARSHGLHADDGGAWGWVLPGTVRERFEPAVEALYRLDSGEIAGPIETPDSFFIVRCDENDPGFEPDFEAVQPQLQEAYSRNAYNKLVAEHMAELRQKSGIEIRTLERFHQSVVQSALAQQPTVK